MFTNKIPAIVLVLVMWLPDSKPLDCFTCDYTESKDNGDIGDKNCLSVKKSDESSSFVTKCKPGVNLCAVLIIKHGGKMTARACGDVGFTSQSDCTDTTADGVAVRRCFCEGDLCNSCRKLTSPNSLLLVLLAVSRFVLGHI